MSATSPWTEVRLSDVAEVIDPNPAHRNPKYVPSGFPFVSTAEFIEPDGVELQTRRQVAESTVIEQEARCRFSTRSVFFSRKGTIGKTRMHPGGRLALLDSLCVINPSEAVDEKFLLQALRSPQASARIEEVVRGVALRQISVGEVRELRIPLPPLNEQRRIVAKLESLQSRSRRAREALDAVPPLLEKLRQSILAAAFRGDLTKDWRAQNPNPEPASVLLARIRTERRQKWEASELAKLKAKGKAPTNDSWKAKYKEPEPVDTTGLPALPDSWCWASVDELLAEGLANGRSVLTDDNGFPVLRLTALKHGRLDLNERKGGAWSAEDAAPFLVRRNDFLVSRGSGSLALVGRGGLVDTEPDGVAFPDTLIRLRAHDLLSREYLSRVWNAALVRTQIERAAKTTAGIFKVSQSDLESIVIPVPSLGEQTRVCSILDATLDGVRRLEIAANAAEGASKTLERSLLAKAFRGDLVPQDPNDEPADTMLDRVVTGAHADASGKRPRHAKAAE